jgi:hypothetical protein
MGHSRKAWTRHVEVSKPLRRLALIVFPSLAMATAASAVAQDHKSYPGALCQPRNSTAPILRDEDGLMFNTGTTDQIWICPVVKDVRAARDPESAQIVAFVREETRQVTCTFQSRDEFGVSPREAPPNRIDPSRPDLLIIQFAVGANVHVRGGVLEGYYYYFRCRVPGFGNAGIVSYFVNER